MTNTAAKIAGTSVVSLGVVALTNFHYVVSHMGTIATGAAAIGVGVAMWTGNSIVGKIKVRNEEKAGKPVEAPSVDERIAELTEALRRQPTSLPQGRPISYVNAVEQQAARKV